jgi:hypothetical protein
MLAWLQFGPDGGFVGELGDPMPLVVDAGGRLRIGGRRGARQSPMLGSSGKEIAVSLTYILWIVVVVLVVLWLLGFLVAHISSGLIHLLLLIALVVILYNLFVGRRSTV